MDPEEYGLVSQVEARHWWYRGLREWVLAQCESRVHDEATILDVGCGTGGTILAFRSRFHSATIVGVDFSPLAIIHARRKADGHLVRGDINTLPFSDCAFDIILALDILYHAAVDEQRALHELRRVLAPAGVVLVNVPAFEWMRSNHDVVIHTARRYTTRQLAARAAGAGFGVVRCHYRNSLLFPLMAINRLAQRLFCSAPPRSALVRHSAPINALFGSVLTLENRLLKHGVKLPLGGSVFAILTKSPRCRDASERRNPRP